MKPRDAALPQKTTELADLVWGCFWWGVQGGYCRSLNTWCFGPILAPRSCVFRCRPRPSHTRHRPLTERTKPSSTKPHTCSLNLTLNPKPQTLNLQTHTPNPPVMWLQIGPKPCLEILIARFRVWGSGSCPTCADTG